MNKKTIIIIIAVIAVIAIAFGVFFFVNSQKVELNLSELNTEIIEKEPFSQMATSTIDADILETLYEINKDQYEEVIGEMPMINVQASMYLVIKAKKGSVDSVKEKVDAYAQKQEQSWSTYLPEQYDLVKARKTGVIGDYIYLIVSENAAEIEALITGK